MSINKVILSGNVGKDPKITTFNDGGSVVQFSLATTDKGYKTKDGRDIPDRTEWHNIVVNRNGLTTLAGQYIKKGDRVTIIGKLRYRTYNDDNGMQRAITEVYADEIEIAPKPMQQAPAPAPEYEPKNDYDKQADAFFKQYTDGDMPSGM